MAAQAHQGKVIPPPSGPQLEQIHRMAENAKANMPQGPPKLCPWFVQGRCTRGDQCRYIHDEALAQAERAMGRHMNKPPKVGGAALRSGIGHHNLENAHKYDAQEESVDTATSMLRRKAELDERRKEEQVKRQEFQAALCVRKVIQKMKIATPENFHQVRKELDDALMENQEKMGSLAQTVEREADQANVFAHHHMQKIAAERAFEMQKEVEDAEKQKEEEDRLESLADEAQNHIQDIEDIVESARVAIRPLSGGKGEDMAPELALTAVQNSEQQATTALEALSGAPTIISGKWHQIGKMEDLSQKFAPDFRRAHRRVAECRIGLKAVQQVIADARELTEKRVAIFRKEQEQKENFLRHDADGDGRLSQEEFASFAKAECEGTEYELNVEDLAKIFDKLSEPGEFGTPAITFGKYNRLKQLLAAAKSEAARRKKKADEEAKQQEIEAMQKVASDSLQSANETLKEADQAAKKGEACLKQLKATQKNLSKDTSADTVIQVAEELESEAQRGRALLLKVVDEAKGAEAALKGSDQQVIDFQKQEISKITAGVKKLQEQVKKALMESRTAKEMAERKAAKELEELRIRTVMWLQEHVRAAGDAEGVAAAEQHVRGELRQVQTFMSFLGGTTLPEQARLQERQATKLFEHLAAGSDTLSDERLTELLYFRYSVVKATVLTETVQLNSKPARRLELGETAVAVSLPTKDGTNGTCRVRCKMVKDGAEGWATTVGNQGSVMLTPAPYVFAVVRETNLNVEFSLTDENLSKIVRKVVRGEILEALEPEKEDPVSGVSRMRCRMRRDGSTGWISVTGNEGASFLEPVK